ncbi:MAG: hypothetical protein QOK40_3550, partial [Miltoncostaeaceae bacterium]|nr:hypothetical protein [Miltoncostaeaceae bacterium]
EALQATMLNAYRALLAGERDVAVKPWLYRIAHNQCISLMRRRSRHEELTGLEESVGGRVDERAEVSENMRQLRADLAQLPDQQRSALVLRELSGLSHEAIAEALDTTSAGAKQLIYEARQTLQEFGEGRALSCSDVRRRVSDGDGRLLRARRVKAHLRSCAGCTRFQASLVERPTRLAMLAPVLPAIAAQRILEAVLASVGGGGGAVALAGAAGGGSGAGAWVTGIGGATEGASAGGAAAGAGAAGSSAAAGAAAGGGGTLAAGAGGATAGLSAAAGAGAGLGSFAMKAAVVSAVALVGGSAAVVPLARQAMRSASEGSAAASASTMPTSGPGGLAATLLAAATGDPAPYSPGPETAAPPDAGAPAETLTTVLGPSIGTIDPALISMAASDPSSISSPVAPAQADLGNAASGLAAATTAAASAAADARAAGATAADATSASTAAGSAAGGGVGSMTGAGSQPAGGVPSSTSGSGSQTSGTSAGSASTSNVPAPRQTSPRLSSLGSVVRSLPVVGSVKVPIVSSLVNTVLPSAPPPAGGATAPAATEPAASGAAGPETAPSGTAAPPASPAPSDPTPAPASSLPQVKVPDATAIASSLTSVLTPLLQGLGGGAGSTSTGATPAPSAETGAGTSPAPTESAAPTSTAPAAPTP